jgi:5-carboxymethyl-2-hydroxymuconate isomerase
MPHLVITYSGNLDADTDMTQLCRRLADTMLAQRDEQGRQVFPTGGTRVLAVPYAHHAIADGTRDNAIANHNLPKGRGRSDAVKQQVGQALAATAREHFEPVMAKRLLGVTVQVDEGQEAFDNKNSNIHPLFSKT